MHNYLLANKLLTPSVLLAYFLISIGIPLLRISRDNHEFQNRSMILMTDRDPQLPQPEHNARMTPRLNTYISLLLDLCAKEVDQCC